jgi:hypothetical protein
VRKYQQADNDSNVQAYAESLADGFFDRGGVIGGLRDLVRLRKVKVPEARGRNVHRALRPRASKVLWNCTGTCPAQFHKLTP